MNYPFPKKMSCPITKDNLKKESKYKNKKVIIDGITFDSQKEGNRYRILKVLERKGSIANLELQKVFILQDKFVLNCKTIHAIKYLADFYYFNNITKEWIVEDVKGLKTEVYKLKKKMLAYRYHLEIKEI